MARILFIGIDYFAYAKEICAALERQGHEVDFHPIEDAGFASKTAKKFAGRAYAKRLAAYHDDLIEQSAEHRYDLVLFIQVHHMAHSALERLRALHPDARFVLYNWDSLTTHDYRPWLKHFDYTATFDPTDADALEIGYLPLFATPRFFEIDHKRPTQQDLYFVGAIGTLHRFEALERLHAFCDENGLSAKFHLKCSPVMKLTLLKARKSLPGVTGKSLSFDGIVDMLEASRGTFDFANHKQSGYTMRLIENMCAGRKIITENKRILDEPFYREDRFLLVDGYDFSEVPEFLARPITSELDVEEFGIDNWARQLVDSKKVPAS
ncbi:MAG: hypothetical protein AAF687_00875 [Pseudomonadota bacterium]